ncbi:MAG: hypothetical protein V1495_05040 [Pseudomonadota bacterium]
MTRKLFALAALVIFISTGVFAETKAQKKARLKKEAQAAAQAAKSATSPDAIVKAIEAVEASVLEKMKGTGDCSPQEVQFEIVPQEGGIVVTNLEMKGGEPTEESERTFSEYLLSSHFKDKPYDGALLYTEMETNHKNLTLKHLKGTIKLQKCERADGVAWLESPYAKESGEKANGTLLLPKSTASDPDKQLNRWDRKSGTLEIAAITKTFTTTVTADNGAVTTSPVGKEFFHLKGDISRDEKTLKRFFNGTLRLDMRNAYGTYRTYNLKFDGAEFKIIEAQAAVEAGDQASKTGGAAADETDKTDDEAPAVDDSPPTDKDAAEKAAEEKAAAEKKAAEEKAAADKKAADEGKVTVEPKKPAATTETKKAATAKSSGCGVHEAGDALWALLFAVPFFTRRKRFAS